MLIETDILTAIIKEKDWLKPYATEIVKAAEEGKLKLTASREAIHELYYIAKKYEIPAEEYLEKVVALTNIEGIEWIPTDIDIDLTALALITEYGLTSIFDAYHAATALLRDPHKTIISTDTAYDKITGLSRVDPRDLTKII